MLQPFTFHPTVVVRTPTYPFTTEISEPSLREHLADPYFTEALYIASPTLYRQSQKWLRGELADHKEADKVLLSVAKYLNRKRSRCTPFGLFATSSVLQWGDTSRIILAEEKRRTRFSMNFLETLAQSLSAHPRMQTKLYYYPNSSIYTIGDEIRYVEYSSQEGKRTYQISAVAGAGEIVDIVSACQSGLSYDEVIGQLVAQNIAKADAALFVDELIQAQILVSELEPTVTGEDLLHRIKRVLQRIRHDYPEEPIGSLIERLTGLEVQLQALDQGQQQEQNLSIYEAIAGQVAQLSVPFTSSELFQVNAFRSSVDASLDRRWQEEIKRAMRVLTYLSSLAKNSSLEEFKRQFYNRYEEAEMPLLPVLDTETGIGYGSTGKGSSSSLIEGLTQTNSDELLSHPLKRNTEQWLRRKLATSQRQGYATIRISKKDVDHLSAEEYVLPTSTSVIFRYISEEAIYLEGVSGTGATNLLGRFANDSEDLYQLARDIADTEQRNNPDVILAEIVHLPEQRTGNILRRPLLRNYELPYLAQSSLPDEQQVALQDVDVSIRKGRIVLRSRRLNKKIIPKLSTAHNYAYQSLPVYQFLCDLQTQGATSRLSLRWHPGHYGAKRLPRIIYGAVILGVATWYLSPDDFQPLCEASPDDLIHRFEQFRKDWDLPECFVLADGDRELLVDTRHWLTVRAWIETIEQRKSILLKEFLFRPDKSVVTDESSRPYANQFIASLIKTEATYQPAPSANPTRQPPLQRVFTLGSEWLYYKFYCGIRSSDKVLLEAIGPLVEVLLNDHQIDQWFFVRYADPDNHLRVRFHLTDITQLHAVIATVNAHVRAYEVSGHIWKSNTGAYRREIERYGTMSMELSEQWFFADSQAVLRTLANSNEDDTRNQRWLRGLNTINTLLDEFGYSLADRYELMRKAGAKFYEEFEVDKALKRKLDAKHRDHREAIAATLQKNDKNPKEGNARSIVQALLLLVQQAHLAVALDDLVGSFIHMHVNRLISSNPRLHELVMYDFLSRHYRSEIAKAKKNAP